MSKNCGNCEFWFTDHPGFGECRAKPPCTRFLKDAGGLEKWLPVWPITWDYHWCGGWREMMGEFSKLKESE